MDLTRRETGRNRKRVRETRERCSTVTNSVLTAATTGTGLHDFEPTDLELALLHVTQYVLLLCDLFSQCNMMQLIILSAGA